jgi:hypothetical protein
VYIFRFKDKYLERAPSVELSSTKKVINTSERGRKKIRGYLI